MARPSCFDCCRKHLGEAEALMEEAINGHPIHADLAIGQLAQAEAEIAAAVPAMAETIRSYRKAYEQSLRDAFQLKDDALVLDGTRVHAFPVIEVLETLRKHQLRELPLVSADGETYPGASS